MTNSTENTIAAINTHIEKNLTPLVADIDQGLYPAEFLQQLGNLGGFAATVSPQYGGLGFTLAEQLAIIADVGKVCGATAFVTWCQAVSAWYLSRTPNAAVREHYLADVASARLLCGTGMSNTVKHLAGIEKMHLKAKREGDSYIVNGILPWVSNIEHQHLIIVCAQLEDDSGYVMFAAKTCKEGFKLQGCPTFSGMEGTKTLNIRFNDVAIEAADVLAHPEQFTDYVATIKPGFILMQAGMGFGVAEASLETIQQCNRSHAHVNQFLDDQDSEISAQLNALKAQANHLSAQIHNNNAAYVDVLKLRAQASELGLDAANSAALHAGARGYLMRHPAQRRMREAMFVAIVTPALKHLRKEIHDIEALAQREIA